MFSRLDEVLFLSKNQLLKKVLHMKTNISVGSDCIHHLILECGAIVVSGTLLNLGGFPIEIETKISKLII